MYYVLNIAWLRLSIILVLQKYDMLTLSIFIDNSFKIYFDVGRLIHRQLSFNQPWGGDPTSLREKDQKQLEQLLQKYRHLVENGELCAGDCPNDGITCPSGVCRAHLR